MADENPLPELTADLLRVHDELVRIEQHWTDQIQSQQQRQATVLAANGFVFGLLGSASVSASSAIHGNHHRWLVAGLIALAAALVFGAVALLPRGALFQLRMGRKNLGEDMPPWLNAEAVWQSYQVGKTEGAYPAWLWSTCASVAANQNGNRHHARVRSVREALMVGQLALIVFAAVSLGVWLHWQF